MSERNFSNILLSWYKVNGRVLPWRNTNNPYIIWVSEIILQQTQVKQGYDYFVRFVERFPNVSSLAQADEDEVMKYWQGLGYYSRARNLHATAKAIDEKGKFPSTYEEIRKLKGVGDYTAAAIASFAYGLPYAVVDGNVYRVLSRYYGVTIPIDTTEGKKYFNSLANELLPKDQSSSAYNQAIMDFGALQCVSQSPQCADCPLCDSCLAFSQHNVKLYPIKSKRLKVTNRFFNYFFIKVDNEILLFKRKEEDIWKGLYEPFLIETEQACNTLSDVDAFITPYLIYNTPIEVTALCENVSHKLTHRILNCSFYLISLDKKTDLSLCKKQSQWVDVAKLSDYAYPKVIERVINTYLISE